MEHTPVQMSTELADEPPTLWRHDKPLKSEEAQKLLQIATDSLLAHMATTCEGALIVDQHARVVWMNERYPHRLGISDVAEIIGKPVEHILPNSLMRTVVETGRPMMLDIMELGSESFVVVRLPLRDSQRKVIGAVGIILMDNALELAPLVRRYNSLRHDYSGVERKLAQVRSAQYTLSNMVGSSPASVQLKLQARRAARSSAAILIQGEAGTGKELLAQAIHNASDRAIRPFVAVNMAAIPEHLLESELFGHDTGKLKMAAGGTLFLDEIADMPATLQAKLLRTLRDGEYTPMRSKRAEKVDARIVAATGCDPQTEIAEGRLHPDLYFRLNTITLHVPPLRDRPSDLQPLCEQLLEGLTQKLRLPPRRITYEALNRLARYAWPGNIRELSNVLERVLLTSDADTIAEQEVEAMIPPSAARNDIAVAPNSSRLTDILRTAERVAIAEALLCCEGNRTRAAAQLGISRTSLYEKVAMHGLG